MSFNIVSEDDLQRVRDIVQRFMEEFSKKYVKAHNIELVNDMLASQIDEKKNDAHQLLKYKPNPPNKIGEMCTQSSILKKWKTKYFRVQPDFSLNMYLNDQATEVLEKINLWEYDVKSFTESNNSKRKGGPNWINDSERDECSNNECSNRQFSFINRRHHCRLCGEVFCGSCSSRSYPMPILGYQGDQRVCDGCWKNIQEKGNQYIVDVAREVEAKEIEVKDDNFYGIKLIHETRKPYFFMLNTSADRDSWLSALTSCAALSKPPINPNPVQAAAFKTAYLSSCIDHGIYKSWKITGTESEMLSDVVTIMIDRQVISDVLLRLTLPTAVKTKAESVIRKQVDNIIISIVEPAWNAVTQQVTNSEAQIRQKCQPLLGPIGKARADLQDKIKQKITDTIESASDRIVKPILEKVLSAALGPLIEAYGQLMKIAAKLQVILVDEVKKFPFDDKRLALLDAAADRVYKRIAAKTDVMKYALRVTDTLVDPLKSAGKVVEAISPFAIISSINDRLRALATNFVYTLTKDKELRDNFAQASHDVEAPMNAAFDRVYPKLFNDAKLDIIDTINQLLLSFVMPPFNKDVLGNEVVKASTGELDNMIPEDLHDFVSVQDSFDGVLTDSATDSIQHSLESSNAGVNTQLEQFYLMYKPGNTPLSP